jgi:predicted peroxiredoxin
MANIFMKSSWGSDDPTRAASVFGHGNVLARAGHTVRIFLVGEAAALAREPVRAGLFPVGWPPLADQWRDSVTLGITIQVCDACRKARGVSDEEIKASGAHVATPADFVAGVEWSDKIVAE